MSTELTYLNDPFRLEFKANIIEKKILPDGRIGILLESTCFYPTGGGQEHDTGTIGAARVLDVFKDDDDNIVHVIDHDIHESKVVANVDRARRFGHMQHHSAQHILTQSFQQLFGFETISVKISADSPSTIDLYANDISHTDLIHVEDRANEIIFENRPIKSYFVSEAEIPKIPFRRPPVVSGQIRVIEVDNFDYSACGGTHCPSTGMIGIIKLARIERRGEKVRVYFTAGKQSIQFFQLYQEIVTGLTGSLSVKTEEIVTAVERQVEQLQSMRTELEALHTEMLPIEARKLSEAAEEFLGYRIVMSNFGERSAKELRTLAGLLQQSSKVIAVLVGQEGGKFSLVVSCADDTGISARDVLNKQLEAIGGKGGGTAKIAQGGGSVAEEDVMGLFANTKTYIRTLIGH